MARQAKPGEPRKVSTELFSLTYGALVTQLIKDYEDDSEVNKHLEKMGYNIGIRLIEDFLSRSNTGRCSDFRETAETISKAGFRMFLNIAPTVTNWSPSGDTFSLLLDPNPLTEFVELPEERQKLNYSNILCGVIRGALEMVQLEVQTWFVSDQLKGDNSTEMRIKFIRKLEDAVPAGDD
ncbi:trafficking protein particle complex subunit 3-like [Watersipora subatra]|uniref:trafficking protein particle complex subunit 3-like n=1 Tax=Watersipora subatra TaxID=2589382 RepID=UPI00355C3537